MLGMNEEADPDDDRVQKHALMVGNKADMEGALDAFRMLQEACGQRFPVILVSSEVGEGLEELADAIFSALRKVRVYLKAPGLEPDYNEPLVLDLGSTVEEAAQSLHKDWAKKAKYAVLWGSGKFDAQRVGRDYVLADGDVIELHA